MSRACHSARAWLQVYAALRTWTSVYWAHMARVGHNFLRNLGATTCAIAWLLTSPGVATAQGIEPIGRFVVDVRGSIPLYGQNEQLAANEGLFPFQLPSRGFGIDVGGHLYPLRWRGITFGVGISLLTSAGERTAGENDPVVDGPTVRTTFTALAPQFSFNFGSKEGWSYLSGGVGSSRLTISTESGQGNESPRRARTINYGGGARWFVKRHLAFTLDLRFYAISALPPAETGEPATPRMTLMVVNAGVSFK